MGSCKSFFSGRRQHVLSPRAGPLLGIAAGRRSLHLFLHFFVPKDPTTPFPMRVPLCVYIQSAIHHLAEEGAACPEIGPSGRTLDLESRNHDEASGGKETRGTNMSG